MQLFGSSGIRRIADKGLIELALKVGLAVGGVYGKVAVGCDTRTSGPAVRHALISGLLSAGSTVNEVGVAPTPTLAFGAKEFDAAIMVTASHNPPEYNGLKLLNPDGSAFDARQREQMEEAISNGSLTAASWDKIKSSGIRYEVIEQHIERILEDFPDLPKVKVVLDCGCGAASVITPYILKRLGCEVIALNCYPSGFFPHDIEPIESNLQDLMRATRDFGADLGIAHDGDADRMMAVDDKGRFISGDKLLVLLARDMGAKKIVTTVDASMVIDELGFKVTRTKVGDIYVSEELKKGGGFGGEPSGAWVFPGVSLCPDGIYAAARVVAIARKQKLSQLVQGIPSYPLRRGSVTISGRIELAQLEQCLMTMKPQSVSHVDGIRLSFEDGWLLVRPSGTEPKIRVTVEARSELRVSQLYESSVKAIEGCAR